MVEWLLELKSFTMDPIDMQMFANKMWTVMEDFEKQLKEEEKGFKIQHKRLEQQQKHRIKQLKLLYSFRIEALECALND